MTDEQITPSEPTADGSLADTEPSAQSHEEAAQKADKSVGAKVKRGLQIALDVVLYLFLAFCIFMLVVSVLSKRDADGAVRLFGHEMRIVASSSMEKSENSVDVSKYDIKDLPLNSMVFVECIPEKDSDKQAWYGKLKVGDVLTFKYVIGLSQEVITHRITAISATDNGYVIELKGDNRSKDADVSTQTIYTSPEDYRTDNDMFNYVIGKVTGNSTFLGYMVYALRQPLGLALIIIIPCAVIIIWQIVRVVLVLQEDKKKKAEKQLEAAISAAQEHERNSELKDRELEQLKQRLAELEGAGGGNADRAANGETGGGDGVR